MTKTDLQHTDLLPNTRQRQTYSTQSQRQTQTYTKKRPICKKTLGKSRLTVLFDKHLIEDRLTVHSFPDTHLTKTHSQQHTNLLANTEKTDLQNSNLLTNTSCWLARTHTATDIRRQQNTDWQDKEKKTCLQPNTYKFTSDKQKLLILEDSAFEDNNLAKQSRLLFMAYF